MGRRAINLNCGGILLDLTVEQIRDTTDDQAVHHQGDGEDG
jgi:hypothetical protein